MARGLDFAKLDVWRKRLARFHASGLSVAAFCRLENIGATRFYYWSRRVNETETDRQSFTADSDCKTTVPSDRAPVGSEHVEVRIGDQVTLRLPVDPGLVVAVVSGLQTSAQATASSGAFQRVDVRGALASAR